MHRIVALLACVSIGGVPAGAATGSGLYGVVLRGPTKPVCAIGTPCSEPAPHVRLMFVRNASVAARVITTSRGTYRVHLSVGRYVVRVAGAQPRIGRGIDPSAVTIRRGWRRQNFQIDTGIR
jgi:hypothetical protein